MKAFTTTLEALLELDRWATRRLHSEYFDSNESRVDVIREKFIETFFPEHVGYCKTCRVRTKYKHDERRFTYFCSKKCGDLDTSGFRNVKSGEAFFRKNGITRGEFLAKPSVRKARNLKLSSAETKAKRTATNLERFGVDNAGKSKEVRKKMRATSLARYGATHYLQTPEGHRHQTSSALKCQDYVTRTGTILKLQGYENSVASLLERQGWSVRSARCGIRYNFQGKSRIYHPDLVAEKKKQKYVVEVKSEYTLFARNAIRKNLAKFKAASLELDFVLIVAYPKNGYMISIKNPSRFSLAELKRVLAGASAKGVRRVECPHDS